MRIRFGTPRIPRVFLVATVSAACGLIILATSARAADDPMAVVKSVVNEALGVLRSNHSPLAERQHKLREIANAHFDFTRMSRLALGYHWRNINSQQRRDFTHAFTAFMQDSYLSKMQDFSVDKVEFVRETRPESGYAEVSTQVIQPGKQPVPVNYMLEHNGGQWLIYDVTVDNISIIANYRNQFNRVINQRGFATVLADLKSKGAQLAAQLGTVHRHD